MTRMAYYDKKFGKNFQNAMKIHGQYTEGFYKKERQKLKEKLNG